MHDHRGGACIEESYERAKWEATSRWKRYTHDKRCPRVSYSVRYCDQERLGYKCWNVVRDAEFCGGHNVREYDKSVGCQVCDSIPEEPTCEYKIPGSYFHRLSKLYGEHVAADVCNDYERQYRSESRQLLHAARREWNTYGDTDTEVAPARHRHKAVWYYW